MSIFQIIFSVYTVSRQPIKWCEIHANSKSWDLLTLCTTITHFESSNHFCAMPPALSMHKILAPLPSSWMPAFSHLAPTSHPNLAPLLSFALFLSIVLSLDIPLALTLILFFCPLRFLSNEADNSAHFWSESISPDLASAHKTTEVFPPSKEETGHEWFEKTGCS